MKISIVLMSLLLLSVIQGWSQLVTVTDNTTLQPIEGVVVSVGTKKVFTNEKGQVDISDYKGEADILFTHIKYSPKAFSYAQLSQLDFKIKLTESTIALGHIVVSANKFEENADEVAQQTQVIPSSDLANMNQPNMGDVMQNSGNVNVQKSQLGGGSPIIRGFETNRILMVVDGVRMNNAIYRGGHLQNIITLDANCMDKIEIVFGPGSVIYGSDALGGVMHFYTKTPTLSTTDKSYVKTNAFVRYGTASGEMTGHFDFNIGTKKFGSFTSFTYSQFGDLTQGYNRNPLYGDWGLRTFYADRINGKDTMIANESWHKQVGSGYSQYDILQKFLYKQSDKVSHVLNFQYSNSSNINRYDRLTQMSGGLPRFGQWYYGPQERLFVSYSLNLKNDKGFYDNGRIIIGFQQIEESRHDRRFNKVYLNHRTENLNIITFNADFAKKINEHELRFGMDAWYNDVQSTAYVEDIEADTTASLDTRYPDGGSTMYSVAAYLSHAWEISEKLILNDGVRINNINLNSQFIDQTFFPFPFSEVTQKNTAVNGNIGLIYMPSKNWRFALVGSSGFRAPNVDDMSKVFESQPGSVTVPNPDLKPEYSYNGDFTISKSFNENVKLSTTAFYTLLTNAITTQNGTYNGADSIIYDGQLSQVKQSVNSAEAYVYGFNLGFKANVTEYFSITSTFNYTYGRIKTDTTDYPMDHIPPVFGKTSFNLKMNKFRGEFFVMYNGAKKTRDYNLNGEDNQAYSADPINGYMPAWATFNVRASYQFNKNIQLQMSLENITDQYYRVFASNISGAGRNFIVTLRGTF